MAINLRARLARLESQIIPPWMPRFVIRYEGSERFPQTLEEDMDDCEVITVHFVGACEGRPKTRCRRAVSGLHECTELCHGMETGRPGGNDQS
jgi:hypothetical protein